MKKLLTFKGAHVVIENSHALVCLFYLNDDDIVSYFAEIFSIFSKYLKLKKYTIFINKHLYILFFISLIECFYLCLVERCTRIVHSFYVQVHVF